MLPSIWPFRRSLSGESWERVTIDHMHLAFLSAEFRQIAGTTPEDVNLIVTPDLADSAQNQRRREILYRRRERLLRHVPESTVWYEVRYLRRRHLQQLRAINFGSWTSPGVDHNELLRVARRKRIPLDGEASEWAPPILWGHTRNGPLTVLEGNNRLVAYTAVRHRFRLSLRVCVGLSRDPCCWHLPDCP